MKISQLISLYFDDNVFRGSFFILIKFLTNNKLSIINGTIWVSIAKIRKDFIFEVDVILWYFQSCIL